MNKFWIVMQREYVVKVKKKSFIILTILMPLIFTLVIGIPFILATGAKDSSEKKVMVIDQTGKYMSYLKDQPKEGIKFVKSDIEIAEARKNVADDVYAYVLITDDLIANPKAITIFSHTTIPGTLQQIITNDLQPALRKEKIASYDIPNLEQIIDDTKVTISISEVQWSKDGQELAVSSTTSRNIWYKGNTYRFLFEQPLQLPEDIDARFGIKKMNQDEYGRTELVLENIHKLSASDIISEWNSRGSIVSFEEVIPNMHQIFLDVVEKTGQVNGYETSKAPLFGEVAYPF